MSSKAEVWLSLSKASEMLGVHPTTLRRWADSGTVPHMRTPGGHRRFQLTELTAWLRGEPTLSLLPQPEALTRSAVGFARQEMAAQRVSNEPWFLAFKQADKRQQMRDTGRQLFALAIQYMSRTRNHPPTLQEGQHIGEYFGLECAQQGISLVDTVRALSFFNQSLIRATRLDYAAGGTYDTEDVRIRQQLRHFLDEVMYACLASYEAACRGSGQIGTKT